MTEIRTRPASREYRANFDKIFKKNNTPNASGFERRAGKIASAPLGVTSHNDEYIDWGEIKTIICCTDDPYFGG